MAAVGCDRGDIRLVFCAGCGAIYNSKFEPDRVNYDGGYENSLHYSRRFVEYAQSLAQRLVATYRLEGGSALDIGSGRGDFLSMLCDAGMACGVGFDPSHDPSAACASDGRLVFHSEHYPPTGEGPDADLVSCRHVLEHLLEPAALLRALRAELAERGATVYLEVPNAQYMLEKLAIWDVIYEHAWYFTPAALYRLVVSCEFSVRSQGECFEGQYLYLDLEPGDHSFPDMSIPAVAKNSAAIFSDRYHAAVLGWSELLAEWLREGRRVAVWGAGSKGVSFLHVVPGGLEAVSAVVDINPRKQGKFLPGSGVRVDSPQILESLRPHFILVMNSVYLAEIAEQTDLLCPGARLLPVDLGPRVVAV
ncbi:MAG: class I SAM-dependent methyltransferase [Actinomycetota bacterium]